MLWHSFFGENDGRTSWGRECIQPDPWSSFRCRLCRRMLSPSLGTNCNNTCHVRARWFTGDPTTVRKRKRQHAPCKVGIAVQQSAMLETTCPREDGGNRVGRSGVSFLMLTKTATQWHSRLCSENADILGRTTFILIVFKPVVTCHGAVRSFRFDGLSIGTHQHGCHQTQRSVT